MVATPGRPLWAILLAVCAYSMSAASGIAAAPPIPPAFWAACWAISCAFLMSSIIPIERLLLFGCWKRALYPDRIACSHVEPSQLKKIPVFADASEDELKQVAAFAEIREVSKGTEVIGEGEFSRAMMGIEMGSAAVTSVGEKVGDVGTGESYGEAC